MSSFFDENYEKDIYLIRHPETVVGHKICYGATDHGVDSSVLEKTALGVEEKLNGIDIETYYSSPLVRCRGLADRLFGQENITIIDNLREVSFGDWEGLTWGEIPREMQMEWTVDPLNFKGHNGENFLDLKARIIPFWNELLKNNEKHIAVVAHAGVIVGILSHLMDTDPAKVFMIDLPFGSVVRVRVKSKDYFKIRIM